MEFGAHLPQMTWGDHEPASIALLSEYARMANELGFTWITANDHIVYGRPWLDGPVALAAVLPSIGEMKVATTIALPVMRGPGPLAKAMAAIDRLSHGRLIVGVGPGSSERDYRAMGIPWEERWPRFEEAVQALRALLRPGGGSFEGAFYSTDGMELLPGPVHEGGPPIWIGSWGSDAGLRRVARLADGWLASAYNTTPEAFGEALGRLGEHLIRAGTDPEGSPERYRDDVPAPDGEAGRCRRGLVPDARTHVASTTRAASGAAPGRFGGRVRREDRAIRGRGGRTDRHLARERCAPSARAILQRRYGTARRRLTIRPRPVATPPHAEKDSIVDRPEKPVARRAVRSG